MQNSLKKSFVQYLFMMNLVLYNPNNYVLWKVLKSATFANVIITI